MIRLGFGDGGHQRNRDVSKPTSLRIGRLALIELTLFFWIDFPCRQRQPLPT